MQVCDNTACGGRGPGGVLCSGQGECACGRCRCRPPYTGDDCECRVDPDACRAPETPNKVWGPEMRLLSRSQAEKLGKSRSLFILITMSTRGT